MTIRDQGQIFEEAVRWHARLHDADCDWAAFGAWLQAAPDNQAIYDRVAMLDSDVGALRDQIAAALPANDVATAPEHRARGAGKWFAGGIAVAAAGLVAAIALPSWLSSPDAIRVYATGPAAARTVTLKDGSVVRLDSNTKLAIRDGDERLVRLDRGAAYFVVHHDPGHPFAVASGDFVVRDIGTRFEVSREASQFSVAVEAGLVDVALRDGNAQPVGAGQQLDGNAAGNAVELRKVDPTAVGSWRKGRLIYDNAPLSLVAADISRYSAQPVSVDPGVADLRLSAVLVIGDGSHLVDEVQALLPIKVRHDRHRTWFLGLHSR